MKFSFGLLTLDTTARTLSDGDSVVPVRPKTLEVLLYLANKPDEIVSKEELLAELWPNVVVDEGVVFQSITEIRKLYGDSRVVLNFPKRGYQLSVPLEQMEPLEKEKVQTKGTFNNFSGYVVFALFVLTLVAVSLWFYIERNGNSSYEQRILILPIDNQLSYDESQWTGISGLSQTINQLSNSDSAFVFSMEDVLKAMQQLEVGAKTSDTLEDDSLQVENIERLKISTGANLIIESELYGSADNYHLIYKVHSEQGQTERSLFATEIDGVLEQLAEAISEQTTLHNKLSSSKSLHSANDEFNDALFAKAIVSYERDWQTSISFFETYLALNPDSVVTRLYLTRLYLWKQSFPQAQATIDEVSVASITQPHLVAQTLLLKGRLETQNKNWSLAENHFVLALESLHNRPLWSLKADILQHHAFALEAQQNFTEAKTKLQLAMSYYQRIESPIGINATRLHLVRIYQQLGDHELAKQLLQQANNDIKAKQLVFLESLLESLLEQQQQITDK